MAYYLIAVPIMIIMMILIFFAIRKKETKRKLYCERCGCLITDKNFGESHYVNYIIGGGYIDLCKDCSKNYYISGDYDEEGNLINYDGIKKRS